MKRLLPVVATLVVVPAILCGRLWLRSGPSGSFGWFAYAPLSSTVYSSTSGGALWHAALGVLTLLLWTVTTLGLIGLVARIRPGPGSVRVLAIVAVVLTVPLWTPLLSPPNPWSLTTVEASPGVRAMRVAALVLVLVIGVAVVLARSRVPARAAGYLLPAAAMTWVVLHTDVRVYTLMSSGQPMPGWADVLPFYVSPLAAAALTVILWILTARGIRALVVRYRPPEALVTP